MEKVTLTISETPSTPRRVHFLWPKPPAKPNIEGHLDCEFVYFTDEETEAMDAQVNAGEMSARERLMALCPEIHGLPLKEGQTPIEWIESHKYGSVIQLAIVDEYIGFQREARGKNSLKRRLR